MAAAQGADEETTSTDVDTDQSTPQPACCESHHLMVRGLTVTDSTKLKLEKTIGSLANLLQLGEIEVVSKGVEPGCLQLTLTCNKDRTCVKNITLEIDGTRYEPAFNRENNIQNARADSTIQKTQDCQNQEPQDVLMSASEGFQGLANATETPAQSHLSHSLPSTATSTVQDWQPQGWSHISGCESLDHKPKFQMLTGVQLDLEAIPSNLHNAVFKLIRLNHLRRSFQIDGKFTIEGPFEDVERFYQGVINLQTRAPGEQTPSEIQHETLSDNEATIHKPSEIQRETLSAKKATIHKPSEMHRKTLSENEATIHKPSKIQRETLSENEATIHKPSEIQRETLSENEATIHKPHEIQHKTMSENEAVIDEPCEIQHKTMSENETTRHTHYRELNSTKEEDTNLLRLPLFHYEYLNKVWADKISALQQRYQVEILPEVVLKLQAKEGQGYPQVKEALDALTNSIQPLITDLGQIKFSVSESERQSVVHAFREMQKNKHLFTLIELEEEYAITGPKNNLKQVKDELLYLVKSQSRSKAILKIENKMSTVVTEMDIPKPHWEILENLFKKELVSINSSYQVLIEPEVQSQKDSVKILMKNQCATQDLSGNALQAFVSLYQKAMTSCIMRVVDGWHKDRVRVLYDEVRYQGVRCIFPEGGYLALIGLPQHVEMAVRDIEKKVGGNIFSHTPPGSWGASSQLSSSASAQQKKEEPKGTKDEEEKCCICMDNFKEKLTTKCNHSFCKMCWEQAIAVKPECPICKSTYGKIEGNQPEGIMAHRYLKDLHLPGFEYCGTIEIQYHFQSGYQTHMHPYPGQPYAGTTRRAYLPDNVEGREILRMLCQAFKQKLIFTIGESRTTGLKNMVTWNDIHHKTNTTGGPTAYGYPDPDYLKRVKEELRAKGIE
ncbi:E3 ubiquitin-protein ligase DTX3L-like [Pleurodeles waltl]|uniref:E3 ubiquitin-protein ligase DTX3L-like n=1 Tax=Pleurodeles waltl TaxID=8319 RepID=UPI0037098018